ncbi:hypothetical protein [Streptomyces abyssomicinicus]|uniref:hypothetical protein n=1 Tax=Streptomyces abyssomicinicus TaxID=574929 RepID=UPI003F76B0B6
MASLASAAAPPGEAAAPAVADVPARAVTAGLLGPDRPVAGFLDTAGILRSVGALRAAFSGVPDVLHTFAAQACPLVPVLRLPAAGMRREVASPGELRPAPAAGFAPGRIVLDSPVKTGAELREALDLGVAVNADNLAEVGRIARLRSRGCSSVLGLRVNPQVGGGAVAATSTATGHSEFGVALRGPGPRSACWRRSTATGGTRLHVHVGSQGCPLPLIAEGVAAAHRPAAAVDARVGGRVTGLDIGGGPPVDFADERVTPTHAEYVAALREAEPALLDGRCRLVTEFGRSLLAKNGFLAARVEYVKEREDGGWRSPTRARR